MDISKIRGELLERIILTSANRGGGSFWIKSIDFARAANLDGTKVKVSNGDRNSFSIITFYKSKLEVQGELLPFAKDMQREYIAVLCENDLEFKQTYEKVLEEVDAEVERIREKLKESVLLNGFVKVEDALGAPDFKAALRESRHGNFLMPIQNSADKTARTFKAGEIYYADLNPVLSDELGGERPVIILMQNKADKTVICVPCSSKLSKNGLPVLKKEEYNLIYDSQICLGQIKTLSSSRLFEKLGELKKEDLHIVKKYLIEHMGIEKTLIQEVLDAKVDAEISENDFLSNETEKQMIITQPYGEQNEIYSLTKAEIGQIVMAKIQHMQEHGSTLQFGKDYTIEGDALSSGITVKLNATDAYNNVFATDIILYPFYAHYYCGDKRQLNDFVLQEALVKILSKKYSTYPKKYAKAIADAYSKKYNNARSTSGKDGAEKGFQKSLSFIGKYINNCDDIMREGSKALNYYDLADITESV